MLNNAEKDLDCLTSDQRIAFDKILAFLKFSKNKMFLLSGYAGTGKTYLSSRIAEYLANDFSNKILITAPTHKAVRVLKNELNINYLNIDFSTIHSALGLRENIDGYGKLSFVPDHTIKPKIDKFNILLVDEVSMLDDEIFKRLANKTYYNNLKIIFIGDSAQIPPVNKLDSIPFNPKMQIAYNIEMYTFTEIVRQAKGHPIIELSAKIRNNLLSESAIEKNSKDREHPNGNIYFIDYRNDEEKLIQLLYSYFTNDKFMENPDFAKVIAWTNETVNQFNQIIRSMIFGDDVPSLMKNEKIIMDAPWIEGKKVIFNNNDELNVLDYGIRTLSIPGYPNMKYYDALVSKKTLENKDFEYRIRIAHESSETLYDQHLEKLKKIALKEKQGSFKARDKWVKYFEFKNIFARTKFNYCITAHKSQGSTYQNSFVANFDITQNPKLRERNRILYTSCTRAQHNLYIII